MISTLTGSKSVSNTVQSIRILLAESITNDNRSIRTLLSESTGIEIIGEAEDGQRAIELCRETQAQIVLMDVSIPKFGGIETARRIKSEFPRVHIIMLAVYGSQQYIYEALRAGANGYILQETAVSDLQIAIKSVMGGKTYISPKLSDVVMDDYIRRAKCNERAGEADRLSAREREVLHLIAEGNSSTSIARTLHISNRTVDTHRHNVMEKLDIHSIAGLTRFAIRTGICSL